jgi:hypothetical protein
MKRYILVCIVFISFAAMAQEKKITWDYPVKPDMEEWNRFKSVEDMYQACQIPDKILQQMDTEELVKVCLNYPALSILLLYNSFQAGYENFYTQFNGIRELMSRKDVGEYLLKTYTNMSLSEYNLLWTPEKKGDFSIKYLYLEIILAQPNVIYSFDTNTQKIFFREVAKKYEEKVAQNDIFGGVSLSVNGWIMARTLHSVNKLPKSNLPEMNHYLETGMLEDGMLLDAVYQSTKKISYE